MSAGFPTFPLLDVRGDAYARGLAHGETFRDRVQETFAFYIDELFAGCPLDRDQILGRAAHIGELTRRLAPDTLREVEGIAAGSGLAAEEILVLNARTEILNAGVDECTALYFADSAVLAQNWDWVERLEALAVIVRHEDEHGHRYLSFTEPGMVAKIGMNDAGLGVCLNILFAPHALTGLPTHLLIGELLRCRSFEAARQRLGDCGLGKASHLLVGAADGRAVSMEYFGDEYHALEPADGVLLHTNHCLGRGVAGRTAELANSCARFDRLAAAVSAAPARDAASARRILLGAADGADALMRAYSSESLLGGQRVGTCASIVMGLAEGRFEVRRGPGTSDRYVAYDLDPAAAAA